MATFTSSVRAKRFQGTYRVVPRVEWTVLLCKEFGSPDWAALYPVKLSSGVENLLDNKTIYSELESRGQLLSPRQACKLFHDGLFIIKASEANPKYLQDRIPEVAHKCFRKKQWRKQFLEACRRVCCRLVVGLGFRPNCLAEDAFIHAILGMTFELGWRRIEEHTACLPEWSGDRDFSRVLKFGANEDVGNLLKGIEPSSKSKTKVDLSKSDVKTGWFKCYDLSTNHMFDHIVLISEEETDDWSVTTGDSTMSIEARSRSDSVRSDVSFDGMAASSIDSEDSSALHAGQTRGRSGSNPLSPKGRKAMLGLEPTLIENAVYHESSLDGADKGSKLDLVSLTK